MKKFLLFSVFASFAALYSCTNEEDVLMSKQGYDKVVAIMESNDSSRTVMNGTYVNWVKDDQIGIFFQGEDKSKAYTLEGDGGTTSGDFYYTDGVIEESAIKVLAYYPYSSDATCSEGVLNFSLKAEHEYSATSSNGFPMIATIAETSQDKIQFKNAGAILAVTVKNLPTDYQYVTLTADDTDSKIAGKAKISYNKQGLPILEIVEDQSNSSTIKITLPANRTTAIEECTFYFPLPVANYTKLTFKLHKSDTESIIGKEKALNAERNMRYNATLVFDKVSTEITQEAASTSKATEALGAGATSVLVTVPSTEQKPTITLPTATSTEETASVNLYFDKIEATTGVTVTEGNEGNAAKEVLISAPEGEGNNNVFNINLPNSTVTLGANGESATYNEVTAATAENTLIISKEVTVTTLKIKKGHVRVHGKIGAISREGSENGEVTYIIKEENATVPESITDENIKVVSAAEYDLITKFKQGGTQTITLEGNVELTQPLTLNDANANITIDLGTYSLTNETAYDYDNCGETECYVFEVQAGTLNITGTTGSVNAVGGSDFDMAVFANTNGVVNINGGKFTNTGKENDGSDLIYARDNAAITISGGEFEAGNKSSDVGNQYVALNIKDNSAASITVTGGKFHKFNPAYNVSENPKKNFAGNNTMVAVSGTEGNEVYDVIDLSNGYTMTSDIEIATPITINTTGSIDFNLGTYNLTNKTAYDYDNCGETECYVFEVQAGTLNITGTTGSVNAVGGSDFDMAVFANTNGVVNINGGKFTNKGIENDGSDLIYVRDNAKVAITGGEFEAGNKSKDVGDGNIYVALNLRDNDNTTASITVSGGKFKNFDPANPGTETATWNQNHTNGFVEENCSSTANGEYYVVSNAESAE